MERQKNVLGELFSYGWLSNEKFKRKSYISIYI